MDREKFYYEVEIGFTKKTYDRILRIFYLAEVNSILEKENSFVLYFKENEKDKEDLILRSLIINDCYDENAYSLRKIKNQDWDKNWKKTIKPVFIKEKIIVYPSWFKKDMQKFKKRILIEIDPKMSFGTGHNETTQLMLELMCDFSDAKDKYVLDYGCGTGVLAIAAIKLGIKKAIAIDIDDDSIENAKEYLRINNVSDKIKLHKKDIFEIREENFDVIYANILRNVIEKNLCSIYEKLKTSGKLIISGVLADEESQISDSLRKNKFQIIDKRFKSEWLGIYAVKEV
jgi:ribosomal protein L11 methyltransferase